MNDITTDQFPIGRFEAPADFSPVALTEFILQIEQLPNKLNEAVKNLSPQQLDTPYRDGGWTIRQVIHHLSDSHMNAYIRMKWTLTEERPLIKAYDEKAWAETAETHLDPSISLALLQSLHTKWVALMRHLTAEDLKKTFIHPETKTSQSLERMIGLYAWHGNHHLAHITSIKGKMGWT